MCDGQTGHWASVDIRSPPMKVSPYIIANNPRKRPATQSFGFDVSANKRKDKTFIANPTTADRFGEILFYKTRTTSEIVGAPQEEHKYTNWNSRETPKHHSRLRTSLSIFRVLVTEKQFPSFFPRWSVSHPFILSRWGHQTSKVRTRRCLGEADVEYQRVKT